jgi:carboxypeptidase Q
MKHRFPIVVIALFVATQVLLGQGALDKVDTTVINRIKEEGMQRSQVMDLISTITNVYGPRLSGSPEYKQAALWAKATMESWGLQNVRLEETGPFGKGWSLKSFSAAVVEPTEMPLIAYPKAWSPGTRGTVKAEVISLKAQQESDLEQYKGKLKGKIVLKGDIQDLKPHLKADASRLTDDELLKMASAEPDQQRQRRRMQFPNFDKMTPVERDSAMYEMAKQMMPGADSATIMQRVRQFTQYMQRRALGGKVLKFCLAEGALAVLDASGGDDGTVFVGEASVPQDSTETLGRGLSAYSEKAPRTLPQVTVATEQYNRMVRILEKGKKLTIEMKLDVEWTPVQPGINIIGEFPGTDKKDEFVVVGGHFDSWHAGTGATDDATGCGAAMEAVRILKALNLKPRRTIIVGLWTGEEQGFLGSRAFVSKYLGERENSDMMSTMTGGGGKLTKKDGYDKFSVYFNHDNGTGKIRGIYLQGNEAARPIFQAWLAPFKDMDASTITLSNTGGTDHLSFDAVGLPGFQFIQDPLDYDTRTHHSNMDVYDRVQPEDMKQASTIMAAFLYNAAMADELFPRKPEEVPAPPSGK